MRAADAAWLLSAIARGGRVELPPGLEGAIETLEADGLVRGAPDPTKDRRTMDAIKADLAKLAAQRAAGDTSAEIIGKERGLRSAVVELSERLAMGEGAAEVERGGGQFGPFRGGQSEKARFTLTQKGRALVSDLGPRAMRVGAMSLADFQAEMEALRATFRARAARAAAIAQQLSRRETLGRAARSVPLGLAAVRADPTRVARAFELTFHTLRSLEGTYAAEQDAAAAECLCLVVTDLAPLEQKSGAVAFQRLRYQVAQQAAPGDTEDAVDAAVLLSTVHESWHASRVALAAELARDVLARGTRITLSLALVALAGDEQVPPHLAGTILELDRALMQEVPNPNERIATAVLLTFPRGEPLAQLERWRVLRQYLARFSADGMALAAALLTWIALEPGEILDDLRMACAEITRHRLAEGAAETIAHGIKLLLTTAALAAGQEGDPEERLALAPAAAPRLAQLGLHGAISALPLAAAAAAAFHATVLDAAVAWEAMYRPTHSAYVYGGRSSGRSWGYG